MRQVTAEALGYAEDEVSLDLIQKAMKSLRISDRDWRVQPVDQSRDAFKGKVWLSNKDAMRKALAGLQKLGFEIRNPDYSRFNFIIQH